MQTSRLAPFGTFGRFRRRSAATISSELFTHARSSVNKWFGPHLHYAPRIARSCSSSDALSRKKRSQRFRLISSRDSREIVPQLLCDLAPALRFIAVLFNRVCKGVSSEDRHRCPLFRTSRAKQYPLPGLYYAFLSDFPFSA